MDIQTSGSNVTTCSSIEFVKLMVNSTIYEFALTDTLTNEIKINPVFKELFSQPPTLIRKILTTGCEV